MQTLSEYQKQKSTSDEFSLQNAPLNNQQKTGNSQIEQKNKSPISQNVMEESKSVQQAMIVQKSETSFNQREQKQFLNLVILLTSKKIIINASSEDTVLYLKQKISNKENIQIEDFQLSYCGKILDDQRLLLDYNIQQNSTVQMLFILPGGVRLFPNLNFVDMKNKLFKGFSSEAPK